MSPTSVADVARRYPPRSRVDARATRRARGGGEEIRVRAPRASRAMDGRVRARPRRRVRRRTRCDASTSQNRARGAARDDETVARARARVEGDAGDVRARRRREGDDDDDDDGEEGEGEARRRRSAGDGAARDDAKRGRDARASGGGGAKANDDDGFDVDALFGDAKKRAVKMNSGAREAAAAAEAPRVRVLLPGQKKPKQKRDKPEFTPVDKPRRFEDGLPVYKSYGDFSDMKAGQCDDANGKKRGPNGEPGGDCPFDCWCCF